LDVVLFLTQQGNCNAPQAMERVQEGRTGRHVAGNRTDITETSKFITLSQVPFTRVGN